MKRTMSATKAYWFIVGQALLFQYKPGVPAWHKAKYFLWALLTPPIIVLSYSLRLLSVGIQWLGGILYDFGNTIYEFVWYDIRPIDKKRKDPPPEPMLEVSDEPYKEPSEE